MRVRSIWITSVLAASWMAAVIAAFAALVVYAQAPGTAAKGPAKWPKQTSLMRDSERPTLVLFAHPQCPCTAATISELDRLMARCNGSINTVVVFVRPTSMPGGWERGSLWQSARRIPGVSVVSDVGGREAARFDAMTSGQAFLYDPVGNLVFSGGITSARGHAGDNDGVDAIEAIVDHLPPDVRSTSVYGCSIFGPLDTPSNTCPLGGTRANNHQ